MVVFVIQNKILFPPTPHTKLDKNMTNYKRFHINCYLKVPYNILLYITINTKCYKNVSFKHLTQKNTRLRDFGIFAKFFVTDSFMKLSMTANIMKFDTKFIENHLGLF